MTDHASRARQSGPVLIALLGATVGLGSCRCPSRDVQGLEPATVAWCHDRAGCATTETIERWLRHEPLVVRDARVTAQGNSQPLKLAVTRDGDVEHVKWKPAPNETLDESNNSPRRELAAYELQKLVLSEDRYVVPPTALRCVVPTGDRRVLTGQTFGDYDCIVGVVSHWIQGARELTDAEVMGATGERSEALGDLNVVTVLAGHRDSVGLNFLLRPEDQRVFAVDNGMTFGAWEYNPMRLFSSEWSDLRVRTLRLELVERLKSLTRTDLERLGSVAELVREGDTLVAVEPSTPIDTSRGVRVTSSRVQLGLTAEEIDGVEQRLNELRAELDTVTVGTR